MKIKILCTLGPASFRPDVIKGLDERRVDLFRINLSHTAPEALEEAIASVRAVSSTPICLDTQGAQVRCGQIEPDVTLVEGTEVRLSGEPLTGSDREIPLWPGSVFQALAPGTIVNLDFDGASLRITEVEQGSARATVVSRGRVRTNKAVTIDPPLELPALTEQDVADLAMDFGQILPSMSPRLRRIAEEMVFQDISSGAAQDIRSASELVRRMIKEWGMSDSMGPIYYPSGSESEEGFGSEMFGVREYSEDTAREIDEEIKRTLDDCYRQASELLTHHRDMLDRLAKALLAFESLDAEEVQQIMAGGTITRAGMSVSQWQGRPGPAAAPRCTIVLEWHTRVVTRRITGMPHRSETSTARANKSYASWLSAGSSIGTPAAWA